MSDFLPPLISLAVLAALVVLWMHSGAALTRFVVAPAYRKAARMAGRVRDWWLKDA